MNKRVWIVISIFVVLVVGVAILAKNAQQDVDDVDISKLDGSKLITQEDVGEGQIPDHYHGNPDAKVIVIEYEDFACSHCNYFAPDAKKIIEEYQDRVLFIYRNFNLGYPNSNQTQFAAEATYLVGGDEAYWKMFDLLWSNDMWTGQAVSETERKDTFENYINQVGVDLGEFNKAVEARRSNGIQSKINRDKALGEKAGVTGTPTWFINGEKVDGVTNQNVRDAINKALDESKE
ncbi:MAG: DsbA family protein [Candidatus Nomurabacteria bacterium]|jgi:protein-disulfide isomerase|nr:DsbA family protein [Candidatus Nomurabacteria bacterium]